MKPYTVIMQVRPRGSQEPLVSSRPVPVYGRNEHDSIERAKRVLECFEELECEKNHASANATEGWALNLTPKGLILST